MTETNQVQAPPQSAALMTPSQKRDNVKDLLTKHRNELQTALPKHITADRLIRVALTAINTTPALLNCTVPSLIGCIIQAAQLGLMPDGAVGEGYLIPFKNNRKGGILECQFMVGYRGLITLAYRSGQIISLQGRAVYENDKFEYKFGLEEDLFHVPAEGSRGKLTYVYAVIRMKNGGVIFDVMSKDDVDGIRRMSKSPNSPAWAEHYDEMAIKSVIRKISKRTPLSPELITAVQLEEKVDVLGESQESSLLLLDMDDAELKEEVSHEYDQTATADPAINAIKEATSKASDKKNKAVQQTIDGIDQKGEAK